MPTSRPNTNRLIQRLRWVMLGVILLDSINTLLGQPAAFWQNPAMALERNEIVRPFLTRGCGPFVLGSLLYMAGMFLAVSYFPRRLALVVLFSLILGHYFGASTWWVYRWKFGLAWPIAYGIVLSAVFVCCGIGGRDADS